MSTTQHSKSVILTLLGSLAFTLSTLPEVVNRIDQSSIDRMPAEVREGHCPLDDLSEDGKVVDCEFTGRAGTSKDALSATVTVKRTKKAPTFTKKFIGDDKKEEKVEAEDVFEISVEGKAQCEKCNMDVRTEMATRVIKVTNYNDVAKLRNFIESEAKRKIEEARTMAREERKQRELQERCEIGEDGEKLTGRARMNCRVEKIASMDDEKAAYYFHDYMKNDIMALLQSSNSRDQALATQILGKLGAMNDHDSIRESVTDLAQYSRFTQRQNQMAANINMLPLNDPRRYAMAQQLNLERQQANSYFQMRGLTLTQQSLQGQMTDNWLASITPTMAQDMYSYQRDIDARYNAIIDRLRVTMESTNNPTTPSGNGRTTRGGPLAPGGQYATTPSTGNVTTVTPGGWPNSPSFNNGATPIVNGAARAIPQYGQPVNGVNSFRPAATTTTRRR
jgi:ribosomal protein S18